MSRLFVILFCALFLSGCQTFHSSAPRMSDQLFVDGPGPIATTLAADYQPTSSEPDTEASQTGSTTDVDTPAEGRLHVYSGKFKVSTVDINKSADQLIAIAKEFGGYLQSRDDAVVVVRVPSRSFHLLLDRLNDCGTVVSRSILTDDVTDEYRDLELRLGVLESSRLRLMTLMEKAATLDDLLKLEEQLAKLTTEIETLKGGLKKLNQQVTYSALHVDFAMRSVVGHRKSSPFSWVNQLGAERVMSGFRADLNSEQNTEGIWRKLTKGTPPMTVPNGFLAVGSSRQELQAVSPEDARVWYREFSTDKKSGLEFWAKAVRAHLVDNLGYRLLDESEVAGPQTGRQMLFEVDSAEGPMRYMLTVSRKPDRAWARKGTVQVVEFAAPAQLFGEYVDAVGNASPFTIAVNEDRSTQNSILVSER
jgi:hypothetical protein